MSTFDVASLMAGLRAICERMDACAGELNDLDGRLGDGDLGVTMQRGARDLREVLSEAPDDLGVLLVKSAQAFTRTSGSSFGTLLATGLMAGAKAFRGRAEVAWAELPGAMADALAAMQKRGKGELGDKTVLDALEAVRTACDGLAEPGDLLQAADSATNSALEKFRGKPSRLGRARMFGEKSIGQDDPGMMAFRRMLDALVDLGPRAH